MKKIVLLIALMLAAARAVALDLRVSHHWQGRLEMASFNTLNWGLEAGIDYYPISLVGVGVGLCGAGDFTSTGTTFFSEGMLWQVKDLHNAVWLRAGLQLVSPAIWKKPESSMSVHVKQELGITIPVPANKNVECVAVPDMAGAYPDPTVQRYSNEGGTGAFLHSKTSVALSLKRWQVWLGYSWSSMDAYSSSRNTLINGQPLNLPSKRNLSGMHLGIGYRF